MVALNPNLIPIYHQFFHNQLNHFLFKYDGIKWINFQEKLEIIYLFGTFVSCTVAPLLFYIGLHKLEEEVHVTKQRSAIKKVDSSTPTVQYTVDLVSGVSIPSNMIF